MYMYCVASNVQEFLTQEETVFINQHLESMLGISWSKEWSDHEYQAAHEVLLDTLKKAKNEFGWQWLPHTLSVEKC